MHSLGVHEDVVCCMQQAKLGGALLKKRPVVQRNKKIYL